MRFLFSMLLATSVFASSLAAEPQNQVGEANQQDAKGEQDEEDISSVWMKKKLDYSQAMLKGLAMGDFETIKTSGIQMRLLNKVEGFVRRRNPRYKMHLRVFEHICDEIVEQADEENLAGVTLAFNQLTVNCVNCHRSLRAGDTAEGVDPSTAEPTESP